MTIQTLAPSHSTPPRALRVWIDHALFLAALLVIAATTAAVHPGSTGETFAARASDER